jgi:hypothetical protein
MMLLASLVGVQPLYAQAAKPAVDVTAAQIQTFIDNEPKDRISDLPIRVADVGNAKWLERLQKLSPLRLCAIVPGEAAPYPSCLGKN